jgi:hypothetical protein
MRIIEIQDGISVNPEKIDGIKKVDETSCDVFLGKNTYRATMSYEQLLSIVNSDSFIDKGATKTEQMAKTMEKLDKYLSVATVQTL